MSRRYTFFHKKGLKDGLLRPSVLYTLALCLAVFFVQTPVLYGDSRGVSQRANSKPVVGSDPGEEFSGRVTGVADGDTIDVLWNRRELTVRLHGVDCPEKSQPFGRAARRFTSELVFGKMVRVRVTDIDRYGRFVGIVAVDGERGTRILNEALVVAGLAWWYRQYAPGDRRLEELESEARKAGRGLWKEKDPVAPWQWRRGVRSSASSLSAGSSMGENRMGENREGWFDAERELRYDPEGPDRDCGDFRTRREAQIFFEAAGGPDRDPHRLDSDGDGMVCEGLPWE
jgi:endonuclease YncB( thermonuclease family)